MKLISILAGVVAAVLDQLSLDTRTLLWAGGQRWQVRESAAASVTILKTDRIVSLTDTGNAAVLPAVTSADAGLVITVKDGKGDCPTDPHDITIAGGATFEGGTPTVSLTGSGNEFHSVDFYVTSAGEWRVLLHMH